MKTLENTISDIIVGKYRTWDCAKCGEETPVSGEEYGCLCSHCADEERIKDYEEREAKLRSNKCAPIWCRKHKDEHDNENHRFISYEEAEIINRRL